MASALAYDELLAWTNSPGVRRFDPAVFPSSQDTLILLSAQKSGSATAILTALVRAVCKSAEKIANRNGGRLPVPMVVELDECANIVRWPELPSLYSTYGSHGIILSTYFQNRSQGLEAFGKNGWDTIWSNARVAVLGPGVNDVEFLRSLSALAGEHDELTYSNSTGRDGQSSTSTSTRRVSTLSVDQLAGMPLWRMIMFPANGKPIMLTAKPWFKDPALTRRITTGKAAGKQATHV